MLLEIDGKLVVGRDERDPRRCPSCRRILPWTQKAAEENIRCHFCSYQSTVEEFEEVKFVELAPVRLLAYF